MRRWTLVLGVGVGLASMVGCAPARQKPATEVTLPEAFGQAVDPSDRTPTVDRWWEAFEDPALDALVARAMSENLDLRAAWERLAQFQAVAVQQGSASWPQVNLTASASRNRIELGESTVHNNNFSLSAAASYEVDVWGRLESLDEAATLDIQASRQDAEAIAMTLAAQVVEVWYSLVEQRALLDLLQRQDETNGRFLELIELRFGQGLSNAVDVYQQRQQVLAIRGQIPLVEARLKLQEHLLATLLGAPAGTVTIDERRSLPELPPLPETGVPSALLQRRPDLEAARLRVASGDARVAAAIADRFPALRLTASTGFQAQDLGDLFDQWVWNMAGNLVLPLIDGQRREAEVARQEAALRERLLAYTRAALVALREVEDALVGEHRQRQSLEISQSQLEVANATLREAQERYLQGLTDFLPVLTSLQAVQRAEQGVISGRRQLISQRIALHRALGGDWTDQLEAPAAGPQQGEEN